MLRLANTYNLKLVNLSYQNFITFKNSKVQKHTYKSFINLNNLNQSFWTQTWIAHSYLKSNSKLKDYS
jgi:acyl carrier protein phosphodiesterase